MPVSRLVLALLPSGAALGLLAFGISVPSIPDMARELGVSPGEVQVTLSVYLLVFAASMLVHGPLSDRFGRRKILLAGLLLCGIASIGGAFSPTIGVMTATRVLQAIGACAGMVVCRAIVRDLYGRNQGAKVLAMVGMAVAAAPALAPLLGGQLQVLFGWRAGFVLTGLAALALFALAWWHLPETNRTPELQGGLLGGSLRSYHRLVSARRFFAYGLAIAGGATAFYAFTAGAPVILIQHLAVSPDQYGLYSALPSLGFILGSFLSSRLTLSLGIDRLIPVGTALSTLAGILMAALALALPATPAAVVAPMLLFGFGNGLTFPNASAGAMSLYPRIAGAASALAGFLQMGFGALGTIAVATLPTTTALPLALVITGAAAGGMLSYLLLRGEPLPEELEASETKPGPVPLPVAGGE